MPRNVYALLANRVLTIPIVATRPLDPANDGVDVSSWRIDGTYASAIASLFVTGTDPCTITSPTNGMNGVELWGCRFAKWWRIGYLNDKADIEIVSATQGYSTETKPIGVFDRLAIAGTPSAGACSAQAAPVESFS